MAAMVGLICADTEARPQEDFTSFEDLRQSSRANQADPKDAR